MRLPWSQSAPLTKAQQPRVWTTVLLIVTGFWHLLLWRWVTPGQGNWDIGGMVATLQLAGFVSLLLNVILLIWISYGSRVARFTLAVFSLSIAMIGLAIALFRYPSFSNATDAIPHATFITYYTVVGFCICLNQGGNSSRTV